MLEYGTSAETREKLVVARLIRVDGLSFSQLDSKKKGKIEGQPPECKRWDSNNGMFAIAINGEIWIGSESEKLWRKRKGLIGELEIEKGLGVPCSNGEKLEGHELIERLTDPDWNPPY